MSFAHRLGASIVLSLLAQAACNAEVMPLGLSTRDAGRDAAPEGSFTTGTIDAGPSPVEAVPLGETLHASSLSAPVDIVRDQWGIPHIYGVTLADVLYGQGYIMARDRFVQMDLARHRAAGTVSELAGALSPSVINDDIAMRAHHLKGTAEAGWTALRASADPRDRAIVEGVTAYAAGVNSYLDEVRAGKYPAPDPLLMLADDVSKAAPWTELDSLALGELEAFILSFDADAEIAATMVQEKAALVFDQASDPALRARAGMGADLEILAPLDPTYTLDTVDGWTGMNGDTSTAAREVGRTSGDLLALLEADRPSVVGLGNDHLVNPARGSNNWVVGPALSATGHAMVANDTHLPLPNPSTFYLIHLSARAGAVPVDVMGASFPGIPGIILGMNEHVAWGATVNNIDVTDVYRESVVSCDDGVSPCVEFRGGRVPLVPRQETFNIGIAGQISRSLAVTLYDVPHHGPIIPRVTATHDGVEVLGSSELSIRYTGHTPAQLFRAALGLCTAGSMRDAVAALDRDFKYGGQNWVIADDQGNFGWTQTVRVPRRAPGSAPWRVLPGDGTAEWGEDLDPRYIPHAYNPAAGFIATANNDPIGVTDDGEPFASEPVLDGAPLYLSARYDFGARIGRIKKRLQGMTAGGNKLTLDDLQAVQADAVTELGQALAPTLLDAAGALAEEIAQPGMHPEISALAAGASSDVKRISPLALPLLQAWTFDTPSGAEEDNPTPAQIVDSQATLLAAAWIAHFYEAALGDELAAIGGVDQGFGLKLLVRAANAPGLLHTAIDSSTRDPVIFDDLATPEVEGKRFIAVKALATTIDDLVARLGADSTAWRWGQVHTLTLPFAASFIRSLQLPPPGEPMHETGFPRHGYIGTVDVAGDNVSESDFTYDHGPAIRFVCELDPASGPRARNALPGGETFDPQSPHYRDQLELWRKNQTFDLAFQPADVIASAGLEYATHQLGRVRIAP